MNRVESLTELASKLFGTTPAHLRGPSRLRKIVRARQAVFWVARDSYGLSDKDIADGLHRERTASSHSCQMAEWLLHHDPEFAKNVRLMQAWATEDIKRGQRVMQFITDELPGIIDREIARVA